MSIPLPTFSLPPNEGNLTDAIAALRREADSSTSEDRRAALLYELGVLEDRARNEAQAARDLLGAVNELPDFLEPLEKLISIIERRKSYKNLGKLLDRLCKVVDDPAERSRAFLARGSYLVDHSDDVDEARHAFEESIRVDPEDPTAWLELELLGAKTGNPELRLQSLKARANLARNPGWRSL
jgi:tetratricopeptide (TPR) repeat protein